MKSAAHGTRRQAEKGRLKVRKGAHPMDKDALEGVAIIGMAGRFPQASNLQRFWENLCQGIESVSFFSAGRVGKQAE